MKLAESGVCHKYKDKYPPMYHFDDLHPVIPPPPPEELVMFRKLDKRQRITDAPKFFNQTFMMEYMDKKWEMESYNYNNYMWCKELLEKLLDKNDLPNKDKVFKKMGLFKQAMQGTDHPFHAFKVDWSKEPMSQADIVMKELNEAV